MIKQGEANPLAIFGLREVQFCPPHFSKFYYIQYVPNKRITDWIWENLSGRFWVGVETIRDSDTSNATIRYCVGFEIPGEASMFALCLDQFNKYEY